MRHISEYTPAQKYPHNLFTLSKPGTNIPKDYVWDTLSPRIVHHHQRDRNLPKKNKKMEPKWNTQTLVYTHREDLLTE